MPAAPEALEIAQVSVCRLPALLERRKGSLKWTRPKTRARSEVLCVSQLGEYVSMAQTESSGWVKERYMVVKVE